MSALDALRSEARAAMGQTGFLRRDGTAAALFISDYPLRAADADAAKSRLAQSGFETSAARGLGRVDPSAARWRALIASVPPVKLRESGDDLLPLASVARRLLKTDTPPESQPLYPIRLTLIYLEAKEYDRLFALISPALAECLRLREPLPTAAGRLIAAALNETAGKTEGRAAPHTEG